MKARWFYPALASLLLFGCAQSQNPVAPISLGEGPAVGGLPEAAEANVLDNFTVTKILLLRRLATGDKIQVMNADGTGLMTLRGFLPSAIRSVASSMRSPYIFFTKNSGGIFRFAKNSTAAPVKILDCRPVDFLRVSPDGARLVFSVDGRGQLCRSDGSGLIQNPTGSQYAFWTPNGKLMYTFPLHYQGKYTVALINPDGSGRQDLFTRSLGRECDVYTAQDCSATRIVGNIYPNMNPWTCELSDNAGTLIRSLPYRKYYLAADFMLYVDGSNLIKAGPNGGNTAVISRLGNFADLDIMD